MIRITFDPDTATATIDGGGVRTELVDVSLSFSVGGEHVLDQKAIDEAQDGWMRWRLAEPRRRDIALTGFVRVEPPTYVGPAPLKAP